MVYNNAAGLAFVPLAHMTLETWRPVTRVELDIIIHTTQPAWKYLLEAGNASIINTASMSALRPIGPIGRAAHAAANGGVVALTKTLAAERAPTASGPNAISPGFVTSPATDASINDEMRAHQMSMHLIRRPGIGDGHRRSRRLQRLRRVAGSPPKAKPVDGGVTAGFR